MIQVGKYVIGTDPLNIILYEKMIAKKGKKAGSERLGVIGYFGTLRAVLRHVVHLGILESQLKDLKHVSDRIDNLEELINKIPQITVADLKKERR